MEPERRTNMLSENPGTGLSPCRISTSPAVSFNIDPHLRGGGTNAASAAAGFCAILPLLVMDNVFVEGPMLARGAQRRIMR